MLIKEVCVENFTEIPAAIRNGAKRIELNDNLAVGGTTVSRVLWLNQYVMHMNMMCQ